VTVQTIGAKCKYFHLFFNRGGDVSGRVLFAATTALMDYCQAFRTYRAPRRCFDCTFVDAACATMATPEYFSSVAIGPSLRSQNLAGIPHGFDNPMREILKEAQLIFSENKPVSFVLSLGSGQGARLSDPDRHITRLTRVHCDGVARDLQYQLGGVGEYLRLNVDRGIETIGLDDWHKLGAIETHTNAYMEMGKITKYIDRTSQWLLKRNGSVTLGQLSTALYSNMLLESDDHFLPGGTSTRSTVKCVLYRRWTDTHN
jgi:hypothetical protein